MAQTKIHFTTPANVLHVLSGQDVSWTDLDLSAYLPEGATGVLLQLSLLTYGTTALLETRKKGYAGTVTSCVATMQEGYWHHNFLILECDANQTIQYQLSGRGPENTADYDIGLFAYLNA